MSVELETKWANLMGVWRQRFVLVVLFFFVLNSGQINHFEISLRISSSIYD